MSSPIPRRLLVHSASLYPYAGTVNSVKTSGEPVGLKFVRFEPVKQNAMTSLGDMKNDSFVMVFDCRNSSPPGTTFKADDKIVFGRSTMAVRKVASGVDDTSSAHHYEVNLVYTGTLPDVISGGVPSSVFYKILSGGSPPSTYSKQVSGGVP